MKFTQSNFKGVSVSLSVSDCTLGLVHNRRYEAPHGRVVGNSSSCGLNNSPGFNAKPVVDGDSQTLLAADVAFRRLH
jgi:hypothetical protein